MKQLNCAIIGCGVIAPLHIDCFKRADDVHILWACDLIRDKAEALADRFDIPHVTTDYADVFADSSVDMVSICTDHGSHAEIMEAALIAGKHVICEKALAAHPDQLTRILDAARTHANCITTGIFQHRFEQHNRYLKSLIDDGAFGTLLSASVKVRCLRTADYYDQDNWRGTQELEGGGVLINQAIHFLDALLFVAGPVTAVAARSANRTHQDSIEVEDCVAALLQFENGALGTLEATSSTEQETWTNQIFICGSEGSITLRNGKYTQIQFADKDREDDIRQAVTSMSDGDVLDTGKDYYGPGHGGQILDFVAAVRENRKTFVPLESAAATVKVVHAIYEAGKTDRWVTL